MGICSAKENDSPVALETSNKSPKQTQSIQNAQIAPEIKPSSPLTGLNSNPPSEDPNPLLEGEGDTQDDVAGGGEKIYGADPPADNKFNQPEDIESIISRARKMIEDQGGKVTRNELEEKGIIHPKRAITVHQQIFTLLERLKGKPKLSSDNSDVLYIFPSLGYTSPSLPPVPNFADKIGPGENIFAKVSNMSAGPKSSFPNEHPRVSSLDDGERRGSGFTGGGGISNYDSTRTSASYSRSQKSTSSWQPDVSELQTPYKANDSLSKSASVLAVRNSKIGTPRSKSASRKKSPKRRIKAKENPSPFSRTATDINLFKDRRFSDYERSKSPIKHRRRVPGYMSATVSFKNKTFRKSPTSTNPRVPTPKDRANSISRKNTSNSSLKVDQKDPFSRSLPSRKGKLYAGTGRSLADMAREFGDSEDLDSIDEESPHSMSPPRKKTAMKSYLSQTISYNSGHKKQMSQRSKDAEDALNLSFGSSNAIHSSPPSPLPAWMTTPPVPNSSKKRASPIRPVRPDSTPSPWLRETLNISVEEAPEEPRFPRDYSDELPAWAREGGEDENTNFNHIQTEISDVLAANRVLGDELGQRDTQIRMKEAMLKRQMGEKIRLQRELDQIRAKAAEDSSQVLKARERVRRANEGLHSMHSTLTDEREKRKQLEERLHKQINRAKTMEARANAIRQQAKNLQKKIEKEKEENKTKLEQALLIQEENEKLKSSLHLIKHKQSKQASESQRLKRKIKDIAAEKAKIKAAAEEKAKNLKREMEDREKALERKIRDLKNKLKTKDARKSIQNSAPPGLTLPEEEAGVGESDDTNSLVTESPSTANGIDDSKKKSVSGIQRKTSDSPRILAERGSRSKHRKSGSGAFSPKTARKFQSPRKSLKKGRFDDIRKRKAQLKKKYQTVSLGNSTRMSSPKTSTSNLNRRTSAANLHSFSMTPRGRQSKSKKVSPKKRLKSKSPGRSPDLSFRFALGKLTEDHYDHLSRIQNRLQILRTVRSHMSSADESKAFLGALNELNKSQDDLFPHLHFFTQQLHPMVSSSKLSLEHWSVGVPILITLLNSYLKQASGKQKGGRKGPFGEELVNMALKGLSHVLTEYKLLAERVSEGVEGDPTQDCFRSLVRGKKAVSSLAEAAERDMGSNLNKTISSDKYGQARSILRLIEGLQFAM
ncbi:hypothetical protein AAMO2058_001142100 [Amorphochlora amoebiformis]